MLAVGVSLLVGGPPSLTAQQIHPSHVVWEQGEIDGPPGTDWMRISDAAVVGNHVIAIDIALPEVRMYSLEGEYLGELGGVGSGPGEWARPATVTPLGEGFRIFDIAQDRFSDYVSPGEHLNTERVRGPEGNRFFAGNRVWRTQAGWWIAWTGLVGESRPSESITDHLVLMWKAGERPDTVAVLDGRPFWRRWSGIDSLVMLTVPTWNLGPAGGSWVIGDTLLVHVDGKRSVGVVYRIDPEGLVKLREHRLPGEERPMTPEEHYRAREWYFRRVGLPPFPDPKKAKEGDLLDVIAPET
ncbi:MAG: hypothetical protein D6701_11700, partial [Gemmatimonadetes bacterium]